MRIIAALFWCILSCHASFAGGRGGHNTTFDPNLFGGNWTCIRSQASGTCGGATTQYFNAACDGVTNDTTQWLAWVAYAIAQGQSVPKLYVPPGSICNTAQGCITWTCIDGTSGAAGAIVWGYGANTIGIWYGGSSFYQGSNAVNNSALIQNVNVGDTVVHLVTAGQASRFAVGNHVMLTGFATQKAGDPPNWQYVDPHIITAISGGDITLNSPAANQLLSTWPQVDNIATVGVKGPAGIENLEPSWDVWLQVFGLSPLGGNQANVIGRAISLTDVTFGPNGFGPSTLQSLFCFFCTSPTMEMDKNDLLVYLYRYVSSGTIFVTSPSPLNFVLDSSSLTGGLNGTGINTTVVNSKMNNLSPGPLGFGVGNSLSVINTAWVQSNTTQNNRHMTIAWFAFNSSTGVLSIANNDAHWDAATGNMGLNTTYYFGETDGTDDSSPHTTFTLSGITSDGTSTFYQMSNCSWGLCAQALPTPQCGGQGNCLTITPYALNTLTQQFNGASPSLSQFVAH